MMLRTESTYFIYPDNEGSRFVWNVGICLPDTRRNISEDSYVQSSEIIFIHNIICFGETMFSAGVGIKFFKNMFRLT
jgi:hypothetical protein